MTRALRGCALVLLLALASVLATQATAAQKKSPPPEQKPAAATPAPGPSSHQAEPNQVPGEDERVKLAHESNEASGGDENAEFKESASVQAMARWFGLKPKTMYEVLLVVNFLIIAFLIYWVAKARVPEAFRSRTREIQKNLEEARKASEDANRRLAEIEERLAKLDTEIGGLRATAEADAGAEEQRIRALAEADKKKIVESAELEIEAAAGQARRDLKAYTAELAVALAEKGMKVDPDTDQALVRSFVSQLKDGK
ncbi:MAG TPA: ATP synthase F0 subunit B [Terriglobales bacterium]|jgi:F-type H+-transporting ATPase subunit b|nr:ATP synthase F0 subunit B [Terriglobales bacterium]